MTKLNIAWKYKDYEIRWTECNKDYELVKWEDGSCYTLLSWVESSESFDIQFCDTRPFDDIDSEDLETIWQMLKTVTNTLNATKRIDFGD